MLTERNLGFAGYYCMLKRDGKIRKTKMKKMTILLQLDDMIK